MRLVHLFLIILSTTTPAFSDNKPESKRLFEQAQVAIRRFLPEAFLTLVRARTSTESSCPDTIEWSYFFQTRTRQLPPAGGFVEYTAVPGSESCPRKERVVVDTNLARLFGYTYLSDHGNLDMVNFEWPEILVRIQDKFPKFVWGKTFEIYSPLIPVYSKHVYYMMPGTIGDKSTRAIVDATSGLVE